MPAELSVMDYIVMITPVTDPGLRMNLDASSQRWRMQFQPIVEACLTQGGFSFESCGFAQVNLLSNRSFFCISIMCVHIDREELDSIIS